MALKSMKKGNQKIDFDDKIDNFVAQASGEDADSVSVSSIQSKSVKTKSFVVFMDESIHRRLKHYRETEAKKIETINYITNLAVDNWLKERNF